MDVYENRMLDKSQDAGNDFNNFFKILHISPKCYTRSVFFFLLLLVYVILGLYISRKLLIIEELRY